MTRYNIESKSGYVACNLTVDDISDVCKCYISINKDEQLWRISSWFTKSGFMNKGYGRETLKHALDYCMDKYGIPATIQYTWNGANPYVLEWLERHFDAVCTCPIAVQKTQPDDDWNSHIYELNKEKVLKYFDLSE